MKKTLLTLALICLAIAPVASAAEPASSNSSSTITRNADGTTTEVRNVSNSGSRKGKTVSKIVITRDSSGKIISVKRG